MIKLMIIVDVPVEPEEFDELFMRDTLLLEIQNSAYELGTELQRATTENARIRIGTGYADKFYGFIRKFCKPRSCTLVANHLRQLAMDELETESRRCETDAGLRGSDE